MKILFIVPYPLTKSPSQRFRFEQYFYTLSRKGLEYHIQCFLDDNGWDILYQRGRTLQKFWVLAKGLLRRLIVLFHLHSYEFVFIHREASPFGPPILEWIIAKVFGKKIIYDFDDAIWLTDRKDEPSWLRLIKWRSKIASICTWSHKVSAGNEYLCGFARRYARNVVLNITTIDTEHLHNRLLHQTTNVGNKIVLGWTGSHSTLKYLKELEPVLLMLETKYPELELLVIADKAPELAITNLRFLPWSFETEIKGLLEADIGIMPLPDDDWTKGKCGFKALQYMALQIPCVIAPVGVNTEIIKHGINGFLASTPQEWMDYLSHLITQSELRKEIGLKGRETVVSSYSVASNEPTFLSLFT